MFRFLPALLLLASVAASAQFKYDNVLYKNVYMSDLCRQLSDHPGYVLVDVRSQGEYDDTSRYQNLNIGHFRGSHHIDIRQMDHRWRELLPWKDKPVFVYCSHSQRSRRVSKMLADSGFSHIYNITGGMSSVDRLFRSSPDCAARLWQSANNYHILYPDEIAEQIQKPEVYLIDLRSDSVFKGISRNEKWNAMGRLKGAVNIPLADLKKSAGQIPHDKKILLTDLGGNDSPAAAQWLIQQGFQNVSIAYDGMDRWMNTDARFVPDKDKFWIRRVSYRLLTGEAFDKMATGTNNLVILDVRSSEEFNNHSKESWRNKGHIKGAINIPAPELDQHWNELNAYKNRPIVVYQFSGSPESFEVAHALKEKGFSRVYVLLGGLWDLRWKGANLKGETHLESWVTDIPPDNI